MKYGIDVSVFQGLIDWNRVSESGKCDFAFIKATQGLSESNPKNRLFMDSKFYKNLLGASRAKVNDIGVYHYLTARTDSECDEEAEYFLSVISPYDSLITGYVAVDVESKYLPQDRFALTALVFRFCKAIHKAGYKPMIYTNPDFLRNRLNDVSRYPLWLAWYVSSKPDAVKLLYPKAVYWQYGDNGSIPGISGKVDVNVYLEETEEKSTVTKAVIYRKGDKYKIKAGDVYSNGIRVPEDIVGNTYTVLQVLTGRILLKEIMSWVKV